MLSLLMPYRVIEVVIGDIVINSEVAIVSQQSLQFWSILASRSVYLVMYPYTPATAAAWMRFIFDVW